MVELRLIPEGYRDLLLLFPGRRRRGDKKVCEEELQESPGIAKEEIMVETQLDDEEKKKKRVQVGS